MLLALAFVTSAAAAPTVDMSKPPVLGPMRSLKLPSRSEWKLPNGLSVVLVTDRRAPLVTAYVAVQGGESAMHAEDAGLAEALAELLTDGTGNKTSKQIADASEFFGGSLSGEATPDAFVVRASALSDKAEAMFSLLSEVVRAPSFPAAEVALRRANMKEELAAARAESDFLAGVAFYKKVFAGHPYSVTAPTDDSIERITRDRVVAAHKRLFTPRGAVLLLVGDIDPARAKAAAHKHFGSWKGGAPAADAPPVPALKRERTVYLLDRPKSSQVSFFLGNIAAREDNPAYFDLLVLNGVLGGSFSSRLVRDIRETKGYTYSIGSRLEHRRTGSLIRIRTPVRTEVAGDALSAIFGHMKDVRGSDPTPEEVGQAKAYLSGSFARRMETQEGLAEAILHQKLLRLPADFYDAYVDRLEAVSPASVRKAAGVFLRPDEMTVVAVGDAAKIKDTLAKFTKKAVVSVGVDGD
ncbi:MAG: hypothetical protein A2506_03850 [Elusimicrobia bacterium RIFOXYD12_FULL_66_9]|nr:MAG: hypothetical protein A2506_03850 [Elusimicrobia bacterium RIFOXYD12_FULL_66_9]